MNIRRELTLFLVAIVATTAMALTPETAQKVIDKMAADRDLQHAALGIAVADVETGELLGGNAEDLACVTASTMKTVTSSAALHLLGPDFTFKTRVDLAGTIDSTTLMGNVVIRGGGDPTLGSRHFKSNPDIVKEIVDALKEKGITHITGRIIADQSAYPFPAYNYNWDVGDLAWTYGAGLHALNYRDNQVNFKFKVMGGKISSSKFTPDVPDLEVVNRLQQGNYDAVDLYLEYARPAVVIAGKARNGFAYDMNISNPAPESMLIECVRREAERQGLIIDSDTIATPKKTVTLVEHESPLLKDIITSLLDRSDNMFTEGLLKAMAAHAGMNPTIDNGTQVVEKLWKSKKLDTRALFQKDGSGLARSNRATPRFFMQMLSYMAKADFDGVKLYQLMPKAGSRIGSVLSKHKLSDIIVLKSGSMSDVQCFVGYYPGHEPKYAFAVLVNNYNCSRRELKGKIDQLLIGLFGDE
ncbi:MAG: D-alanyl-D-alanine carboxypeptidase/D-alanyl-D-alanine-endopeptidase [Muribaculaceae bacterium]|nr:D-alanyl-D-alanine carboxypeptidase/D-alanyl-D-alanine-endopeptidase [Muribaculaceae bacterium]